MKKIFFSILSVVCAVAVFAGGGAEAGASATHGKYLAGQGIIVPPEDIHPDSYIAQIDYDYPEPVEKDFEVYLYSGNRQISNHGQSEVFHIGIKAAKVPFEDLPPLNLAFVIDASGSMAEENKMQWVKESFDIFIDKVRDIDYVSLVTFSGDSDVVFRSTRMNSERKRERFRKKVMEITPGGGTNLVAGLEDGYSQVLSNYRGEYNNRVLFLTDGVGKYDGLLEMAETYKEMGINVSTIGVGSDFDVNLMVDLARRGGGSSRFISDREEMKETFGYELDRMIMPVAKNLEMRLLVPEWIDILETWGYQNRKEDHAAGFTLPTLHNGDYETILAEIRINETERKGMAELGRFLVEYNKIDGTHVKLPPMAFTAELVDTEYSVYGVSDYRVIQSSTMLYIARSMQEIGTSYYEIKADIDQQLEALRSAAAQKKKTFAETVATEDQGQEIQADDQVRSFEKSVQARLKKVFDRTIEARKIVLNNRDRLDGIGFEDELEILDHYIDIIGEDLEYESGQITGLKDDREIDPPVQSRPLTDHLENMFHEINLSLVLEGKHTIAVIPFTMQGNTTNGLTALLDSSALSNLAKNERLMLVDRMNMEQILEEQSLGLSGLVDTDTAIQVGQLLSAEYMITGNIIPMSNSLVIFSRVINIESSEIETVSQVIVPVDDDVRLLLN